MLANADDARDCVHDVLLRVWQTAGSYRAERGTLRAFLVVAVRNDAISRRRSAARHLAIERRAQPSDVADDVAVDVVRRLESARVRRALESLPPEQRAVFEGIYLHYKTQAQVASELNIPLGTVKSRVSSGLHKLHARLAPEAQRV